MEISFQIWVIFTWSEPLLIPSLETVCFFCTSPWGKVNIKSKGFLGSTSHTSCCTFVPLSLHIVADNRPYICLLSDVSRSGVQGGCKQQSRGGVGRQFEDHCPATGKQLKLIVMSA